VENARSAFSTPPTPFLRGEAARAPGESGRRLRELDTNQEALIAEKAPIISAFQVGDDRRFLMLDLLVRLAKEETN